MVPATTLPFTVILNSRFRESRPSPEVSQDLHGHQACTRYAHIHAGKNTQTHGSNNRMKAFIKLHGNFCGLNTTIRVPKAVTRAGPWPLTQAVLTGQLKRSIGEKQV